MIFTNEQISENWLYAPIMEQINELHEKKGGPTMEVRGPTTETAGYDAHDGLQWTAESIGDWGGREQEVADTAQNALDDVLNAIDRGRLVFYKNQGDAWEEFANQAYELIREYNSYEAFDRLCNEWETYES